MTLGQLVGALHEYDVALVDGIRPESPSPRPSVAELAEALVRCREPRLALCVVPLLLRHPGRAHEVADRAAALSGETARELRILYTAAAAAQRCWGTRLALAGVEATAIEDRFSAGLGLPPVGEMHGRLCLRALDDLPSSWDGELYPRAGGIRSIVELFIGCRGYAATR